MCTAACDIQMATRIPERAEETTACLEEFPGGCLSRVYIDDDEGLKRCHLEFCVCTMRGDGDEGRFRELEG